MIDTPTRLPAERFWLYGVALALVALIPAAVEVPSTFATGDWDSFHSAGERVGTTLLNAKDFHYIPGVAWFCAPLGHMPIVLGYAATVACTLLAALVAAWIAARIYGLDRRVTILLTLAWAPTFHSVLVGQNATIALLLMLCATWALVDRHALVAGLAVGCLLYKPTYAASFVVLLCARREWRALAIVAACAALWYVASALAVGGDWAWPVAYAHDLSSWYAGDFNYNAAKALSVPLLLERFGLSALVVGLVGATFLIACVPKLARVPLLEAASIAPLVGLATSPHAWEYDACVLLPAIFWVLHAVQEPWRTRLVCSCFLIAMLWPFSATLKFDPFAIVVVGGAGYWLARR